MRTTGCAGRADRQSPRHWSAVTNRTFSWRASAPLVNSGREKTRPRGIGNRLAGRYTRHYVRHHRLNSCPCCRSRRGSCSRRWSSRSRSRPTRPSGPGAAAEQAGGRLVLVPRVDGRFATVGTIAQIESAGELPNGTRALVIRGVGRARIGAGETGAEGALHVQVEPLDEPAPTPRARELAARVPRGRRDDPRAPRRAPHRRRARRASTTPGQLADTAAYSPDLDAGAARRAARDDRRRGAPRARARRGRARCSPTSS